MATPIPSWTMDDDTTPGTAWSFTGLAPGSPSAWQERHLWNNQAGASPVDPMLNWRLRVQARIQGDTPWQAAGIVALDTRSIEVEILGGSVGSGIEPRSPVRIGAGVWLDLPEIPSDSAVHLRARVSLPGVAGETALDLNFQPDPETSAALSSGVWESAGGGIRLGIGDGSVTQLLSGGVPQASGTPDDNIQLPDLAFIHLGVPYSILTDQINLDQTDGAATTLGSGEGYKALLSLGANVVTLTKGLKAVLADAVVPATPAGELAYSVVTVDDSGTIEQADITLLAQPWGYPLTGDGLNAISGPGEALVGGRWPRGMTPDQDAVAVSATSRVWRLQDGSITSTSDGSRPEDRSLALGSVTANATDITAIVDERNFQDGRVVRAQFTLPAPSVGDAAYWVNGTLTPLYLRPIRPILLAIIEDPSVLANTAGSWKVEVEKLVGFTWTSLFASSGTDDRRPEIPFGSATGRDDAALPEDLRIEPGQVVRVRVLSPLPSGGTPAEVLLLSLLLEPPLG